MYYMLAIILFYRFSFSSVVSNKTYFVRNLQRQISKPDVPPFPRNRKRKALTRHFFPYKTPMTSILQVLLFLYKLNLKKVFEENWKKNFLSSAAKKLFFSTFTVKLSYYCADLVDKVVEDMITC